MGKVRGEKRFHTVPTHFGGDGDRGLESSEEEESDDVEQERRRRRVRRQRRKNERCSSCSVFDCALVLLFIGALMVIANRVLLPVFVEEGAALVKRLRTPPPLPPERSLCSRRAR